MNRIINFTLRSLHKIYSILWKSDLQSHTYEKNPEIASKMIQQLLISDKPCMIARFGAFELSTIVNYLGIQNKEHSIIKYIKGEQPQWWWNKKLMMYMQNNAGFFPSTKENLSLFSQMMINDTKEVDILGSWLENEKYLTNQLGNAKFIHLHLLEPFWSNKPWTCALKGKKVLVIHPFSDSITKQYSIRDRLFTNSEILPEFELKTIKAVQSIGGSSNGFKNWFDALSWMKNEMDRIDYDICLIGCGAYGFPLAAHAKRRGKKAIHLGGALQLLFGIKGNRWENPTYGVKEWGIPKSFYSNLMNEHWVKPDQEDRPINANDVEGACYW